MSYRTLDAPSCEKPLLGCAFTFYNVNLIRKNSHAIETSAPMSASMPSNPSKDDISIGRWPAWQRHLSGRVFGIGWALAVVIATAGWFYFILQIVWYVLGPFLQ